MKELIDIFRMNELSKETRINIIVALGRAIDDRYDNNITGRLVYELVKILDPNHNILSDKYYLRDKQG